MVVPTAPTTNASERWSLQKYVVDMFLQIGAVVETAGYALIDVVLPEDVQPLFEGRGYLRLAFDYEAAEEEPEAEFVTYGSAVVDRLAAIGTEKGRLLRRYVVPNHIHTPPSILQRATKGLSFPGYRRPELEATYLVDAGYVQYEFYMTMRTDEKIEWIERVWIDAQEGVPLLIAGRQADSTAGRSALSAAMQGAYYEPNREPLLPLPPQIGMPRLFEAACTSGNAAADAMRRRHLGKLDRLKQKEIDQLDHYYTGLEKNLRQRQEKATDPKKISEFQAKLAANAADHAQRRSDVETKYSASVSGRLDRLIWYFVPSVLCILKVERKGSYYTLPVLYSLLTHNVLPPICKKCGSEARAIGFNAQGEVVCAEECS